MTNIIGSPTMPTIGLERALEYAVIQSWDELMPVSASGLIHVEYRTASDNSLDFLKIWSSTRWGHWRLVCEYWMRPLWSHATGMFFGDDFHSKRFAQRLEFLMKHDDLFAKLPDQNGLIQVHPPTPEQRCEAERWRMVTFGDQGSKPENARIAA